MNKEMIRRAIDIVWKDGVELFKVSDSRKSNNVAFRAAFVDTVYNDYKHLTTEEIGNIIGRDHSLVVYLNKRNTLGAYANNPVFWDAKEYFTRRLKDAVDLSQDDEQQGFVDIKLRLKDAEGMLSKERMKSIERKIVAATIEKKLQKAKKSILVGNNRLKILGYAPALDIDDLLSIINDVNRL